MAPTISCPKKRDAHELRKIDPLIRARCNRGKMPKDAGQEEAKRRTKSGS